MVDRFTVLVACSHPESEQILRESLSQCGLDSISSSTVREARRILARQVFPLVLCSSELADGTFRDILRAEEVKASKVPVVVVSRGVSVAEYLEAMELGAFDVIAYTHQRAELERIVSNALRRAAVAAHA